MQKAIADIFTWPSDDPQAARQPVRAVRSRDVSRSSPGVPRCSASEHGRTGRSPGAAPSYPGRPRDSLRASTT